MAEGTSPSLLERRCEIESDSVPGSKPEVSSGCTLKEKSEKLPIFKKPHCFIFTDSDGKFAVSNNVLSQIRKIDVPLNVVAVCGLYRTGKSYLMNRLAGEKKGFSLGGKMKAHTKGIWAWCKIHPKQEGQVLLLLDTEGLADIKKGNTTHDNHLFSLAILLSSTMIYNMSGVFNQEALEKLAFITELTQHVRVIKDGRSTETNESLIRAISPFFILCLRDFYLEIEVEDSDTEISPNEYFEHCLESDSQSGCESYNMTRACIKNYFPKRTCFILSQPAFGKKLRDIEAHDDKELNEDFIREIVEMQTFVYGQKYKVLDAVTNIPVDGSVFASLTTTYVETLRKGLTLTYQDAFSQVSRQHNEHLVAELVQAFDKFIDELQLLVPRKLFLQEKYSNQQSKTIDKFREEAYLYCKDDFENQIMRMLVWQDFKNSKNVEKMRIFQEATKLKDQARYDEFKKEIEEKIRKGFEEQKQRVESSRLEDTTQRLRAMEELLFSILARDSKTSAQTSAASSTTPEVNESGRENSRCHVM